MKRNLAALSLFLCILSGTQVAARTRRALLIGINTYWPKGSDAQHPAKAPKSARSEAEQLMGVLMHRVEWRPR
jgi:hypothetical protein